MALVLAAPGVVRGDEPDVTPPRVIEAAEPEYPPLAREAGLAADVTVLMTIDETGRVVDAELVTRAGAGFDEAALAAARRMRFEPARRAGEPIASRGRYTFRFRPPPPVTAEVTIRVVDEAGAPVVGARVEAGELPAETDATGAVTLAIDPGTRRVSVTAPGYLPAAHAESVDAGEAVTLEYTLHRDDDASYQTVVYAGDGRREVSRTRLSAEELDGVAGTFGEPLRAVMTLPGVSSGMSGLAYPIVRGAMPGESRFEIDGIDVPLLYHFMFGTSVIHPEMVGAIELQPGSFSARHGRAIGGLITIETKSPDAEPQTEVRASLIDAGAFHARRFGDSGELSVAAKAGTLGLVAAAVDPKVVLSYADYQLRVAHEVGRGTLALTTIGALDVLDFRAADGEPREDGVYLGFHRADLRYRRTWARARFTAGVQLGNDVFGFRENGDVPAQDGGEPVPGSASARASALGLRPYVSVDREVSRWLHLAVGADLHARRFRRRGHDIFSTDVMEDPEVRDVFDRPRRGLETGAWLEARAALGPVDVEPSVRVDHYRVDTDAGSFRGTAADPRLRVGLQATDAVRVEAAAGIYHAPPRLTMADGPIAIGPLPAADGIGARHGINRSQHYELGTRVQLAEDFEASAAAFLHRTDFDADLGMAFTKVLPDPRPLCEPIDTTTPTEPRTQPLGIDGRTMGLELMLRRRLGASLSGWLSYTLSHDQRRVPGVGTFPSLHDQRHVGNAAISWKPGGRWRFSAGVHAHSGRPVTLPVVQSCGSDNPFDVEQHDYKDGPINGTRLDGFWRVDLRAERVFVFDSWRLQVFFELFNAALQSEMLDLSYDYDTNRPKPSSQTVVLPMIGARGQW